MNSRTYVVKTLFGAAVFSALSSCSLTSSKTPSLYVDLSSVRGGSRFSLLNGPMGLTPPTSASAFSCYGVNVTGPGIPDTSHNPNGSAQANFNMTLTQAGNYCSYRGVVTPPLGSTTGAFEAALQVPPGNVRLVQVVGVADPVVCASGVLDDAGGSTTGNNGSGSRFFEIGRAVVTDLFADRSVDIAMSWPTGVTTQAALDRQSRALDCGGSNCTDFTQIGLNASNPQQNSITTSATHLAQRLTTTPGYYIRRASVSMTAVGSPVTVTATVYTGTNGTISPGDLTSTPVIYTSTVTVASATATVYTFDFYNSSYGYLQMVTGSTYWIVLSSNASSPAPLGVTHAYNSSGSGSGFMIAPDLGTWSAVPTTDGLVLDAYGCTN